MIKYFRIELFYLKKFLDKYGNSRFIIFGFTFMVWQHLYKRLNDLKCTVDMSNAILMTGGGWKKFAGGV